MTHPIFPELEGRKAVVTGGATGIGRAIVEALRRQKVDVALCDINPEAAAKTGDETGAIAVSIDVRKRASVEEAFAEAEERLGGFDMLFANAGVSSMQRALDLTDEEWDFNFDVNTRGIF
nr:SDR family NAD(P)-dependent oxidoreductase [Marinicella sp. W31]MDC2878405.1 SDR family NAD(P)-dependent oxidoreductase [Marinicella sp. W31]